MPYQLITNSDLKFEMVNSEIRIRDDGKPPYVIELLFRPHGHAQARWTPSIQCDLIEEAQRIARAMASADDGELTLVMAGRR